MNTAPATTAITGAEIADFMKFLVDQPPIEAMHPFAKWRWFQDPSRGDNHVCLEPIGNVVTARQMRFLDMFDQAYDIEAEFRATPHVGVYLSFSLRSIRELTKT